MRQPKELQPYELVEISSRVRNVMIDKGYYVQFQRLDPDFVEAFVRQVYIEVRVQLEKK